MVHYLVAFFPVFILSMLLPQIQDFPVHVQANTYALLQGTPPDIPGISVTAILERYGIWGVMLVGIWYAYQRLVDRVLAMVKDNTEVQQQNVAATRANTDEMRELRTEIRKLLDRNPSQ